MRNKLSGKALVIQLTRDNIRIAAMQLGAKARLFGCTEMNTPKGAVEDGVIHDIDELAKVIKDAARQPGFAGIKRVVFALCTTQVIAERVSVPAARGEKLERIMDANMDVFFPVDVSDYGVTRQELGHSRDKNGRKVMTLQLWAIPAELLSSYYALAAACGLSVAAIDYCGNSLVGAMGAKKEENITEVLLMAEPEMLVMTLVQAGKVSMQRSFLCGSDLEQALSEAMMVLDYYRSFDEGSGSAAEAVICGGLAENEGFCRQVSEAMGIPARLAESTDGTSWSVCVGAARTRLDFGGRRRRKRALGTPWHYGAVLVGGAAAILSLTVLMGSKTLWESELAALENMETAQRVQTRQRSEAAQAYADYEDEHEALTLDYENILAGLREYSHDVGTLLEEIRALMPEEASVKEMFVDADGLSVMFSCGDKEEAALLIGLLRDMKYAEVDAVRELVDEGEGKVRFSVELLYTKALLNTGGVPEGFEEIVLPEKLEVER